MRILAKVGGAQLEEPLARARLARSVLAARGAGHEVVLVHGGGNQIRDLSRRLGLADRYQDGLRITDAATADVVVMVLAGLVNKQLVASLREQGVPAAGLSGVDGGLFSARAIPELGYVGAVSAVDPTIISALRAAGLVPVVATVAPLAQGEPGSRDRLYNVNADLAAGPLAAALDCDALLFLTDVPGVLDARRERIASLTRPQCAELRARSVITGGMIPKVDAALAGLAACGDVLVKIAPADGEDAILAALRDDVGTAFVKEEAWTSTS